MNSIIMIKLNFMKIVLRYIGEVSYPLRKDCRELIIKIDNKMEEI